MYAIAMSMQTGYANSKHHMALKKAMKMQTGMLK
jgi:hypothetical protein